MAWTTPRTWVTGETVSASIMNTYVRDNQTALAFRPVGQAAATTTLILSGNPSEAYPSAAKVHFDSLSIARDVTTSQYRLIAGVTGLWAIAGSVRFPATANDSATSLRAIKLYVNEVPSAARDMRVNAKDVDTICSFGPYMISLAAGQYVDVRAWHNAVGDLFLLADCWLNMRLADF